MTDINNGNDSNLVIDTSAFISFTQGMGFATTDRSSQYYVRQRTLNPTNDLRQYEILFELNNLAANVIDLLPQAMGVKPPIFSYHDADITKRIQDKIDEITQHFIEASKLARLVGGSGILIDSIGSLDSKVSLNNDFKTYTVLEGGVRGDLAIKEVDRNLRSETYNEPSRYAIRNSSINIDASRVIPFYGIKCLTKEQKRVYRYWGMPVLQRCIEKLKALDIADNSLLNTLNQFSKIVLEINNFNELMTTRQGRLLLKERVRQTAESWNNDRILAMQVGEKAYRLEIQYTGIEGVLSHLKEMVASSVDIPYSKVFNAGSGAKGLGGSSSGSKSVDRTDERQWADTVKNRLVSDWDDSYRYLIDLWLRVLVGDNYGTYKLAYQSILQLSETEESDLDYQKAQTNEIYVNTNVVTPDQVAEALAKDVPLGSVIDVESLQNQAKILNEAQKALEGNGEDRSDPNLNDLGDHPESLRSVIKDSLETDDKKIDHYAANFNDEDNGKPCNSCVNWLGEVRATDPEAIKNEHIPVGNCKLVKGQLWVLASCDYYNVPYNQALNELTIDDNAPVKRIIKWNGLNIALQYLPFQLRHGRVLTAGYGHIQNLVGADKMALDCWVGTNLNSNFVAIMEQWIDGKFDEDKVIIGCANLPEAKALYCANMPSEFLAGIKEISIDDLIRIYSKGALKINAAD